MKHVYYLTQRPRSIGTYEPDGCIEYKDYDGRVFINCINRGAYSRLVYDRKLTDEEVYDYELLYSEKESG